MYEILQEVSGADGARRQTVLASSMEDHDARRISAALNNQFGTERVSFFVRDRVLKPHDMEAVLQARVARLRSVLRECYQLLAALAPAFDGTERQRHIAQQVQWAREAMKDTE